MVAGDTNGNIFLYINVGTDSKPKFNKPTLITKWKPTRAKPEAVDWNNDGKIDILFGDEKGNILLMLNKGSKTKPDFTKPAPLKTTNDKDLNAGMRVDITVYDWDNDKKKDLICGDEFANVTFYKNIGTDKEPKFDKAIPMTAKGWPISPKSPSSERINIDGVNGAIYAGRSGDFTLYQSGQKPAKIMLGDKPYTHGKTSCFFSFSDINSDGTSDLLSCDENGNLQLLINESKTGLKFTKSVTVKDGVKNFNIGYKAKPTIIDYNNDGKPDIMCQGNSGEKIRVYLNKGTKTNPVFNGYSEPEFDGYSPINGGYRCRVDIADYNSDGKSDLLYGVTSYNGGANIYVFLAE
ncbi:MAG: VCBS repeat-containing protein [Phycisphaerae bacterium]|nr:VCBS repeat-containing protein [Phycisphaerae bacterium]